MKTTIYRSSSMRKLLFVYWLIIHVSSVFAKDSAGDKPLKEKPTQSKVINENPDIVIKSGNTHAACLPKNCVPVIITKSKSALESAEVFSNFLADNTMNISVTNNPAQNIFEYGLRFVVTRKGRMVKVGSRLPKAGIYRISVWDVATRTIIVQQYVYQIINNVQAWADIPALALTANKEYFISIISDNWNEAYPKAGSIITYPITKGSLKVLAFGTTIQPTITSAAKFPDSEDNTHSIPGFVDFGFWPD
ncbi:hypothetical protein [Emticicia agri]|uniref:DUF4082 domain-containing protein n=1 Tax=Emticicia agri TaxID=2492393 RepID=A0A4Q5M3C0_9BACT|nr:hypothetical protein [Emticicia agri]RYU96383.1 hypothetical protein EWM59_07685 [Emticicia agri]